MILKQYRRVGIERRVLQKNHKEQGWLLQNRIPRGGSWSFHKMRSTVSTGEKHIVLCTRFQYPAPNLSGSGTYKGSGLALRFSDLGQLSNQSLCKVFLCHPRSASSNPPLCLSLCSNCPNLGIVGSLENQEVQKRELSLQADLCTVPPLFSQGMT